MATCTVDVRHTGITKETKPLPKAKDYVDIVKRRLGGVTPESCSKINQKDLIQTHTTNAFVGAVHTAYAHHYPLVLSPDIIWMCIAQGFSQHVNANAENLRHHFVAHDGKKTLKVQQDNFVKGSPDNNWPEAFEKFSLQIQENVGKEIHDMLTPDFTTTGPIEKAAAQVVLMDTFKEYFEYRCCTSCGIPEFILEGTVEDWTKLRKKANDLAQFDLDWWISSLDPILAKFIDAVSGTIDEEFWTTIYKQRGGSGGPYITGWILTLFPYLGHSPKNMHQNRFLKEWNMERCFCGATTDVLPRGVVSTPFIWEYFSEEFAMEFYAGFMAVSQEEKTLGIRPEIGWAVVDEEEVEKMKLNQRRYYY